MSIPFDTIATVPEAPAGLTGRFVFPLAGSRLTFASEGPGLPLRHAGGGSAFIYLDEACTTFADIRDSDAVDITGDPLTVDDDSLLPLFYGPVGVTSLWVRVNNGTATLINSSTDTSVLSTDIDTIVKLTQAAYDALVPDTRTLYLIVG